MGVGAAAGTTAAAGAAAGGIGWGGAAALGGGLLSGLGSIFGSSAASSGAKDAANAQLQMYQQTSANLLPYNTLGQAAGTNALMLAQAPPPNQYLTQAAANMPLQMTQAQLEATPGYQFNLSQGLKAAQGAAAARGLGVSGASLKGAATYATGLASSTYQQQFNNAQQNFTNLINLNTGAQGNLQAQYARLAGLATTGENAAAQTGAQGTQAAGYQGNYLNQAGLSTAAGYTGVGAGLAGGVQNYLGYQTAQNYINALKPQTPTTGYGTSAPGTFGTSAAGNPVMTGYAPAMTPGQLGVGGFMAPYA